MFNVEAQFKGDWLRVSKHFDLETAQERAGSLYIALGRDALEFTDVRVTMDPIEVTPLTALFDTSHHKDLSKDGADTYDVYYWGRRLSDGEVETLRAHSVHSFEEGNPYTRSVYVNRTNTRTLCKVFGGY